MLKLRLRLNNAERVLNAKDASDFTKACYELIRRNILNKIQEKQVKEFNHE